ncbi:type II secretion system protein [Synoicihabitans lomoniglobus]|uniref:Prepilin-type N-terminal cleavage/methylation domain-containing protein n=1 Tax=Synoicihabitans lomoniglobus TaxID=2909285 RepID=A0AAF0CS72_9BACT|nr:prepilin-type N-terminal cleavage/methylation domain-containing protein [Opitutaceae bacterium LMO-M01]WED67118.1 prepilin-type N-terminal cleavage/methylation domain-containing protein [Opitutaceae bacterium LMO-M01]
MRFRRSPSAAFTLIELLTVIAILGILAAIIIPTVSSARNAAHRAKTKAQFSQWAAAMELFRQEYGFYPDIAVAGKVDPDRFASELTGRSLTGAAVTGSTANRKGLSFYALSADDLDVDGTHLVDAFGNSDIGVRIDTNRDGIINASDTGSWVSVVGADGVFSPMAADEAIPTSGVRARVVFYSAGQGRDANDLVLSWR